LRNSRHAIFAVSLTSLIAAGCGEGTNDPSDAQPPSLPDAALVVDAAPADAPESDIPDAMPVPPVGTCVPSEAIAPPGSGDCVAAEVGGVSATPHIGGWYNGRFIAEASCSITSVAPFVGYVRLELDCTQTAGDAFETALPMVIDIDSGTRVLPPGLVAGEEFALRIAYNSFDSGGGGPNQIWLTIRDADDGALLFALGAGPSLVPETAVLARLSLTADDWLAPVVVDTVTGVCPATPANEGTLERVAADVTVPGEGPVRLNDRLTAYLGDAYFVELGTFSHFSNPEGPDRVSLQSLMIVAADRCVQ
jgi:hypothetical protein